MVVGFMAFGLEGPSKAVSFLRVNVQVRDHADDSADTFDNLFSRYELQNPVQSTSSQPAETVDYTALVINASREMAKEITLQLSIQIPGCSIIYAPTLELARWILKRREIDLVVSDPILPDGSVTRLNEVLGQLSSAPDLVVVGNINEGCAKAIISSGYNFGMIRESSRKQKPRLSLAQRIERSTSPSSQPAGSQLLSSIRSLGADLRNDLNNPLQEIVAMAFVARSHQETSPELNLALNAIEKAALNMSSVVRSLEVKIQDAVFPVWEKSS